MIWRGLSRFSRFLDALERHFAGNKINEWPDPPTETAVDLSQYPSPLESFHDEVLAKLELQRRATQGASTTTVCQHWVEQDERDADAEDDRIRRTVRALTGRAN